MDSEKNHPVTELVKISLRNNDDDLQDIDLVGDGKIEFSLKPFKFPPDLKKKQPLSKVKIFHVKTSCKKEPFGPPAA